MRLGNNWYIRDRLEAREGEREERVSWQSREQTTGREALRSPPDVDCELLGSNYYSNNYSTEEWH